LEPLHPPDAVHPVVFVLVQIKLVVPPEVTVGGFPASVTVGAPGGATVTVTLRAMDPPGPVQVNVNVVAAVIAAEF
jgi:hypothetical protein